MKDKTVHIETFIVTQLCPIKKHMGKDGKPYHTRIVMMRSPSETNHELQHSVFFSRGGVGPTNELKQGQLITLEFHLNISKSRAGIAHTNITPLKIIF